MTTPPDPTTGQTDQADEERRRRLEHDDRLVDEWEEESFPASDPPADY